MHSMKQRGDEKGDFFGVGGGGRRFNQRFGLLLQWAIDQDFNASANCTSSFKMWNNVEICLVMFLDSIILILSV